MLHRKIGFTLMAGIAWAIASSVALANHIPAANIPPTSFTVTPGAIGEAFAPFTATFKEFGYSAVVTQNAAGAFTEAGVGNIGSFAHPDTGTIIPAAVSGLGAAGGYSLYESFTASGFAAASASGGIDVTFTSFTLTLFANPAPGVNASLIPGTGAIVIPPGSIPLGSSTSFVAGGAHVFGGLVNGDFDILGTFLPTGAFLSGSAFTGSPSGALYDLNGVTSLICPAGPGGVVVPCLSGVSGSLPPFGTAFQATFIGSGNQSFAPSAPIPEPASGFLLGSGLAGLGIYGFRRRKLNQI